MGARHRVWGLHAWAWPMVTIAGMCCEAHAQVAPQILISVESGIIGQAADIAIGPEGDLYVLDRLNSKVVILSGQGAVKRQIGRGGSGPGEFRNAASLQVLDQGGFEVVDRGNNRVQRFDVSGEYLMSRVLPPFAASYPVAVSPTGEIAVNTIADTTLVAVHNLDGGVQARFAPALAAMPAGISMAAVKREVLDGRVPGFFRNTVQPHFAPDGSLWLAFVTDGKLEYRTPEGTLRASLQLTEPEMKNIRDTFFERYRDPSLRGLPSLAYIADLYPTRDACWVLLHGGDDDDATVLRVSNSGAKTGRWRFGGAKGAGLLAVDEARSAVFLGLSPTAEVVRVVLGSPSGSWGTSPDGGPGRGRQ